MVEQETFIKGDTVAWDDDRPGYADILKEFKARYGEGPFIVLNAQYWCVPRCAKLHIGKKDADGSIIPIETIFSSLWFKKK